MPEPLQIRLHLDQHPTLGHLRAFLDLAAEAPNSTPLGLTHTPDREGVTAIHTDLP